MLRLNLIDRHPSSPMNIYNHIDALATRKDLYTGDDFYFGFDSSNHTFIDIIRANEPLAIKHGPTLSLYQRTNSGYSISMYYIDTNKQALRPVLTITAKPDALHTFRSVLPWSFTDFYLEMTESRPEVIGVESAESLSSEYMIESLIELLATNRWPDVELNSRLTEATNDIMERDKEISITLADLNQLKTQIELGNKKPDPECCVAPHDPFHDTPRLDQDYISEVNPNHITVRLIKDRYPRIEIISPKSEGDDSYTPVYEKSSPELFKSLHEALSDTQTLTELVTEHFPAVVATYSLASNHSGSMKR